MKCCRALPCSCRSAPGLSSPVAVGVAIDATRYHRSAHYGWRCKIPTFATPVATAMFSLAWRSKRRKTRSQERGYPTRGHSWPSRWYRWFEVTHRRPHRLHKRPCGRLKRRQGSPKIGTGWPRCACWVVGLGWHFYRQEPRRGQWLGYTGC